MAITSLNHSATSSNLNFHSYDLLYEYLNRAHSLACFALNGNFSAYPPSVLHGYFSVLTDVLDSARYILDEAIKLDN